MVVELEQILFYVVGYNNVFQLVMKAFEMVGKNGEQLH